MRPLAPGDELPLSLDSGDATRLTSKLASRDGGRWVQDEQCATLLSAGNLDAAFARLETLAPGHALSASQEACVSSALVSGRVQLAAAYVRRPECPQRLRVLLDALTHGTESTVASFIAACSRGGAFDLAQRAFSEALARGGTDVRVFNAFIAACGRSGYAREAAAAFSLMCAEGVHPTGVTFNTLISAHAAVGDVRSAATALAAMRLSGFEPDERTYGALLAGHAAATNPDADAALRLHAVATRAGCLSAHGVSSLATCLSRATLRSPHQADAWMAAVMEAAASLPLSRRTPPVWSAVATLCARLIRPCEAVSLLSLAGEGAHHGYVLASVLTACRGAPVEARVALSHLWTCPERVRTTDAMNAAITLMAGTLDEPDEAAAVASRMAARSLGPSCAADVITFNTLIGCASARGDGARAQAAFDALIAAGFVPSQRSYAGLARAYGRGPGGAPAAAAVLQRARDAGLIPNEYCWSALCDAHVKDGDVDGAFAAVDAMLASGVPLNAVTFGVLLDGCIRSDDVARALVVARRCADAGVVPSSACANMLVVACSRAGLLDDSANPFFSVDTFQT